MMMMGEKSRVPGAHFAVSLPGDFTFTHTLFAPSSP